MEKDEEKRTRKIIDDNGTNIYNIVIFSVRSFIKWIQGYFVFFFLLLSLRYFSILSSSCAPDVFYDDVEIFLGIKNRKKCNNAWFRRARKTLESFCSSWWLMRDKSQWKNLRDVSSGNFRARKSAHFQLVEGWRCRDESCAGRAGKSWQFRLLLAPAFLALLFQQGTTKRRPRPRSRHEMTEKRLHNPHHRSQLQCESSGGGAEWHRKRSDWLRRLFISISEPVFLLASLAQSSAVRLSCVRCGNSGIVGFFSWTCAHHRRRSYDEKIIFSFSEKRLFRRDLFSSRKRILQEEKHFPSALRVCWWIWLENSTRKHKTLCGNENYVKTEN